ncbi:hypothetical protein NDU88_006194 [Pleurodeles waltl]|uniref:Uncharacterized protein n=1 Tax=Pleurodeles waltl TaxID=8319 RepID=A0AAV7SNX1_PLEWA|nr:hypothetical protein NDU88_006194 [Pleurodeles waltl]
MQGWPSGPVDQSRIRGRNGGGRHRGDPATGRDAERPSSWEDHRVRRTALWPTAVRGRCTISGHEEDPGGEGREKGPPGAECEGKAAGPREVSHLGLATPPPNTLKQASWAPGGQRTTAAPRTGRQQERRTLQEDHEGHRGGGQCAGMWKRQTALEDEAGPQRPWALR